MDVSGILSGVGGGAGGGGDYEGGLLIPPINFGIVEENLYRSGMPNELNFPFLERLNLKKILYLAPEDPTQQL